MSFIKKGVSALGKLLIVIALGITFLSGLVGVVYMRLQGEVMKVPEIVGKDFVQSESELAELGLRIKKRADRVSSEKPNTIIEQLPKAGETVKTGQMILVVTSKGGGESDETPATLQKNTNEQDDSEKIEELISDKPKKSNKTNQNSTSNKKKTSTTRDVLTDNTNSNSNSSVGTNSNKKGISDAANSSSEKSNKNSSVNPSGKPPVSPETKKPESPKPAAVKSPGAGDVRPRKTPNR